MRKLQKNIWKQRICENLQDRFIYITERLISLTTRTATTNMNLCNVWKILLFVGIVFQAPKFSFAQNGVATEADSMMYVNHEKESILDHLLESKMSKLEIVTNLDSLFGDRRLKAYKDANATFTFENGESWTDSLEVKVRGVYRAAKCDNPPLKIKYSKKILKKRGLKKRNEYKVVYPCKNNKSYQNYIYKEYLIYKMYNELTDKSLRVHLIDFTLRDVNQEKEDIHTTGFLIEHREEIIKRLDAHKNDMRCLPVKMLSPEDYTLFQVFQFMIGNVDWLIETCKNAEVIQLRDSTIIPIPYDFDYTGMVKPAYAKPFSHFNQIKITDRYFLGHNKNMEELTPIFELFKEKKNNFIELINDFSYLSKRERKVMIRYLQSFYRILDRPAQIKKVFVHDMGPMKEQY